MRILHPIISSTLSVVLYVYERGLDDPAFVKAFEVMEKMYQYTTSDAVGADAGVSGGHFLNERTAVFMNGPWFIARYTSDGIPGLHENIGVAPAPMLTGGEGAPGGWISEHRLSRCDADDRQGED